MSFIAVFVDLVGSNNILRICIAGQQTIRFPPLRQCISLSEYKLHFSIYDSFLNIFFPAVLLDWKQCLRAEWN